MQLVYTLENRILVSNARNILENAGIPVVVKNEYAGGAAGDLPALDTWMELWVADEDATRAGELLAEMMDNKSDSYWACNNCQERNPDAFEFCWNCQHAAD